MPERPGAADPTAQFQDIVDDVSGLLDAPAVLEDAGFVLIAYSSQGVDVDPVRAASILGKTATAAVRAWFEERGVATATGPVHVPGDPERQIAARACLPARCDGVTQGYLWVLAPASGFDPERLARAEPLARRAGELLAARRRGLDSRVRLISELLSGDPAMAGPARAALAGRGELPAEGALAVVVVRTPAGAGGGGAGGGDAGRGGAGGGGAGSGGGAGIGSAEAFVVGADEPDDRLGPALRRASRLVGDYGRAGIGTPRSDVRDLAAARYEADCAARVALARPLGRVVSWADLGFYRVAGQGAAAVEALIAGTPAAVLRSRGDAELVRTALVYLDQAGHAARTAAELSVHRQTLYYRLEKIEQLCGVDLDQGEPRLQLHLGLALGEVLPYLR